MAPGSAIPVTFAPMSDSRPSRHTPQLDALGKLCVEGKQSADYLWQVPDDAAVRQRILEILDLVETESRGQGRTEMPKVCEEMKIAARASPSPQQVDLLVNGFDRLYHLWESAKSGLF